jgi:hypothetical protein
MGRTWPGLLLAPMLALADQGVAYALLGWGCSSQQGALLHAVHAFFLAATACSTFLAWRESRPGRPALREAEGFTVHRRDFMAQAALGVGLLSAAMIVAMWIPQWMLSPCYA